MRSAGSSAGQLSTCGVPWPGWPRSRVAAPACSSASGIRSTWRVHAAPTTASVAISYRPDGVTVRVVDDGRRAAAVKTTPTDGRHGHGLTGMRERARLYGGTLVAGRRPEGGFAVELTLPEAAPVAPETATVVAGPSE